MTTNIHRETAQILQFPVRPRRRPDSRKPAPAGDHDAALNVIDTCWYHDEAIKDSASKNGEQPKPC